jgi:Recombinase
MQAQTAIRGRHLGGRPSYGYRVADAGAHPDPAKARFGVRLHVLEPDPVTAPVVRRISAEFLQGLGYLAIAERLNADQIPSPAGYDPTAPSCSSAVADPIRARRAGPRSMSSTRWSWGGVVGEAGGAPLDAPLVAFLLGWPQPVGVGLDGVEAALGDLHEQQVGGDHPEQDQEEADG